MINNIPSIGSQIYDNRLSLSLLFTGEPAGPGNQPDPGYVFVYTSENLQVYDHLDQPVQVSVEYANS